MGHAAGGNGNRGSPVVWNRARCVAPGAPGAGLAVSRRAQPGRSILARRTQGARRAPRQLSLCFRPCCGMEAKRWKLVPWMPASSARFPKLDGWKAYLCGDRRAGKSDAEEGISGGCGFALDIADAFLPSGPMVSSPRTVRAELRPASPKPPRHKSRCIASDSVTASTPTSVSGIRSDLRSRCRASSAASLPLFPDAAASTPNVVAPARPFIFAAKKHTMAVRAAASCHRATRASTAAAQNGVNSIAVRPVFTREKIRTGSDSAGCRGSNIRVPVLTVAQLLFQSSRTSI